MQIKHRIRVGVTFNKSGVMPAKIPLGPPLRKGEEEGKITWANRKSFTTDGLRIRCEKLNIFPEYAPFGEISVPVKGGQKVKGYYIKALIKAIKLS